MDATTAGLCPVRRKNPLHTFRLRCLAAVAIRRPIGQTPNSIMLGWPRERVPPATMVSKPLANRPTILLQLRNATSVIRGSILGSVPATTTLEWCQGPVQLVTTVSMRLGSQVAISQHWRIRLAIPAIRLFLGFRHNSAILRKGSRKAIIAAQPATLVPCRKGREPLHSLITSRRQAALPVIPAIPVR